MRRMTYPICVCFSDHLLYRGKSKLLQVADGSMLSKWSSSRTCSDRAHPSLLHPSRIPARQRRLGLSFCAASRKEGLNGPPGSDGASPQDAFSAAGFIVPDRLQGGNVNVPVTDELAARYEERLKTWPHGSEVAYLPDIRSKLQPRPSPFLKDNYFGGGFVSEKDRVYLASLVHGAEDDEEEIENGRLVGVQHSRKDSISAPGTHFRSFDDLGVHGQQQGSAGVAAEPGSWREFGVLHTPRFALRAGPRETIYFNPSQVNIAIVTVGGLCPGLNDVVRSIVSKATDYGVPEGKIRGIQFGFKGFTEAPLSPRGPIKLSRRSTDEIHLEGGTVLGTSRARPHLKDIVKWLDLNAIDMLFVVGGIGGISVAYEIVAECERRNVVTSVIAVPKSIDNDILLIDKAFGFDTAVEEAQKALLAAKVEASSAYRGVGLVKLMGRQSGFIAVQASLASGLVDVCLIPEIPVQLDGPNGLITHLESLLESKGHAMICVAEGAAQDLIPDNEIEYESEGDNLKDELGMFDDKSELIKDVGPWLKKVLKQKMKDIDVKYIDPSYLIRSVPATPNDRIQCKMLAHGACHAAFAGYTGTMVGLVNTQYVYLPLAVGKVPRRVDPKGALWNRLRSSTGQPNFQN